MTDIPIGGNARMQLLSFVERVERIAEERRGLADDAKEVFAEAKSAGFDTKIMRKVIALRSRDQEELKNELALVDTYLDALEEAEGAATSASVAEGS